MMRRPPRSTRTDTLFPYTTLFRSDRAGFLDILEHALALGFRLFGDHALDRVDIMILIVARIEFARLLADQRLGEVEPVGVGFAVPDVAEIIRRLVHFLAVAQHLEDESLSPWPHPHGRFTPTPAQFAEPHPISALPPHP